MEIILKIGGSVITDKNSEKPKEKIREIKRVCREIKQGLNKEDRLILIHGVGSFGHPIARKYRLNEGMTTDRQKAAFLHTQLQVDELNRIFCRELAKAGLNAAPINAASSAVSEKGELISMSTDVIEEALNKGMIPVLYGVPIHDRFQNSAILSGDRILSYLANKFRQDIIIHATDTDGIFTSDPKLDKNANRIVSIKGKHFEDIEQYLSGSASIDVTGGMKEKIREVMLTETDAEIINGLVPGNVQKALAGERGIGTSIGISEKVEVRIPVFSGINKKGRTRGAGFKLYILLGKIFGMK